MSDFEKIYSDLKTEIEEQSQILQQAQSIEIPRDSMRRPWNFGPEVGFEKNKNFESTKMSVGSLPWYLTISGLAKFISLHRNQAFGFFAASLLVFGLAAAQVQETYYSSVYIYAPAKMESIGTRLSSLFDKVEFASLPFDVKIPTMLISKELETSVAKQWVLTQVPSTLDSKVLRASSGYILNSETLVINGYGRTADEAMRVTDAYKKYFEFKVQSLKAEHMKKLDHWVDQRLEDVHEQLGDLRPQLNQVAGVSNREQKSISVRQKLSDSGADLILKKIRLERLNQQLLQMKGLRDFTLVNKVDDPELQDLINVYQGLVQKMKENPADSMFAYYSSEKSRFEIRLRSALEAGLLANQKELVQLKVEIDRVQVEISRYGNQETEARVASGQETEIGQTISAIEKQRDELLKLKNQIQLDSSVPSSQYRVIQEALPDFGTRSPHPVIRYGLALLGALMATLVLLMLAQFFYFRKKDSRVVTA